MILTDLSKTVNNIKVNFIEIEENYNSKKSSLDYISQTIQDNKNKLKIQEGKIPLMENSKDIINKIILSTRDEAISFIENIVNCALQDVFSNDKLKLKLILKAEGAKTAISTFIEENGELYDIESGRGGGLRDLVSTAILLCCRAIVKPKIEVPLLLDESFKFLHSTKDNKFKSNAFAFLREVANKLDTQIILITGEEDKDAVDVADNILYIYKKDGQSYLGNLKSEK